MKIMLSKYPMKICVNLRENLREKETYLARRADPWAESSPSGNAEICESICPPLLGMSFWSPLMVNLGSGI
jgi:hypothetical protein